MNDSENVLYAAAAERVHTTPELAEHTDFILADWPEGDAHWQWVVEAPVAEIVDWAIAGQR